MKQITIVLFFILFSCFPVIGQTYSSISFSAFVKSYSASIEAQPQSNFSVKCSTKMYKDIQNNELVKDETASIIQGSGTYQSYVSETIHHIQNNELRIEIDSAKKSIIGSYPIDPVKGKSNMEFLLNVDSTSYQFLKADDSKYTYYRVIEKVMISSNKEVTLRFNKQTKELSQISILYWPSNYFSNDLNDEIKEQPRLVVDYSNYKTVSKANEVIQKELDNWVSLKNKKYQLAATKTNYTFNDLRATSSSN